jgi:hypothetical protein
MLEAVPVVVASVARAFSCPPKASRSPAGRSHRPAHAKCDPSLCRSGASRFIIKVLEKSPWCTTSCIMVPSFAHTHVCLLSRGSRVVDRSARWSAEIAKIAEIGESLEKSASAGSPSVRSQIAQIAGMPRPRLDTNRESGALIPASIACRSIAGTSMSDSENSETVRIQLGLHPLGETARPWTAGSSPCLVPMSVRQRCAQQRLRDRGQT